ncbi:MAG: (2Fe-2S) ferredoxin domain-containing protein, partial [Chloroflexota bacterium]|nr:(2Fe-2S) ferredoxin domain-containing protein [Chloroflexota bacterium]
MLNSIQELEHLRERLREQHKQFRATVMMCGGPGCQASQCKAVIDAISKEISKQGLTSEVRLLVTGCHGFCEQAPV